MSFKAVERYNFMCIPDVIRQFANSITMEDVICLTGLILLGSWLLRTSWGRKALADSIPRKNNMPVYLPFIPLLIWFGTVSIALSITKKFLPDLLDWQNALLENFILCLGAITAMAVIVFLVRTNFERRLKGFGLNPKTIGRDFLAAFVNLLSVWPLVLLALTMTLFFGQLVWGQDFQLQQHEELKSITAHSQLSVRVLIVITAVIIVPVFEEMLFRGLFQTMIRSFLLKPWLSIVISSALFAVVHQSPGHWPALFVFSICLGYSYEKSGSLFRPVFIHAFFNAASIIAMLYSV